MATQQRQHGLISDEYGFLVGSRRLEQGIESVDDKVQRIIEFLEKNAKPVRLVNSQTVAQNQVAKDVSKLVTLTEKSHKEIQKTKVANSQTLRNGGNIKNRQADENSNLSTRPTRTVNSQTGATNSSESAGSSATELSTDQPTRTVNSQTSQQAQNRQRDANGRFIGGEGEQSKSGGGLFKGMTQAVRNGFLQANSDGQNLDPSLDALYEVKNVLSPVGRFAGLMLRPLGALFKSRKRNEPLSREEEKHNKKEIKLLERIARMGGGGGGLLGGLLGRGGGFLGKLFKGGGKLLKFGKGIPLVGALLTAMSFSGWSGKSTKEKGSTVGAGVGGIAGGAIGSLLGPVGTIVGASVGAWVGDKLGGVVAPYFKVWTDSLVKADIPAMLSKAWDGFISLIKKAFEATPIGAAQTAGSKLLQWGRGVADTVKSTISEAYNDTVGDSGQSAGGAHKSGGKGIGWVSSKFESGGNYGAANKDNKGWAYGKYQFNSDTGGLNQFFNANPEYREQFKGLNPSSEAFNKKWRALAKSDPNFSKAQDKAAYEKFYKPREPLAKNLGYKLDNEGVRESLFSASIQHGGVDNILRDASKAKGFKDMTPEQQVKAFYEARKAYVQRIKIDGGENVKQGLYKRYQAESKLAIEAAKNDKGMSATPNTATPKATAQPTATTKIKTPKGADALAKFALNAEMPTATPVATPQKTGTPKSTALPPTISKPPVVPSLSMKPTINMKAQPIQFRSAAKVEAIPKIETVPEMHTSPKPMLVQSVNSGDNIGQNLSDRGLAHLVTGGLGENRYGA